MQREALHLLAGVQPGRQVGGLQRLEALAQQRIQQRLQPRQDARQQRLIKQPHRFLLSVQRRKHMRKRLYVVCLNAKWTMHAIRAKYS